MPLVFAIAPIGLDDTSLMNPATPDKNVIRVMRPKFGLATMRATVALFSVTLTYSENDEGETETAARLFTSPPDVATLEFCNCRPEMTSVDGSTGSENVKAKSPEFSEKLKFTKVGGSVSGV